MSAALPSAISAPLEDTFSRANGHVFGFRWRQQDLIFQKTILTDRWSTGADLDIWKRLIIGIPGPEFLMPNALGNAVICDL